MIPQALCLTLESLINKALDLNLQGKDQLAILNNKTLSVSLTELGFPLCFTVNNSNVLVTSLSDASDCQLNTSIKTLLALKKSQQLTELIKQEKLDISGDIKVAQQFANIAESLEIDWQSELAKHIGDIPTYKLEQLGKNLLGKLSFFAEQVQADAGEWLVHEKKWLVTTNQTDDFSQQVNQLSTQTNYLEKRFATLLTLAEKSIAAHAISPQLNTKETL